MHACNAGVRITVAAPCVRPVRWFNQRGGRAVFGTRSPPRGKPVVPDAARGGGLVTDAAVADRMGALKFRSGSLNDHRKVREIVNTVEELLRENDVVVGLKSYNTALQLCGRMRNPELGEKFFAAMQAKGIEPDHFSLVALASAYASVGKVRDVTALLDPTGYASHASMGVLLRAYSKARMTHTMLRCFAVFLDRGMKVSERHFVVLVAGHDDAPEAFQFLTRMKSIYGVVPNTLVCNAALGVCIHTADMNVARKVVEFMQKHGIKEDESTYSSLAGVHSKCKNIHGIHQVAEMLVQKDLPIPVNVYATFIRCCGYLVKDALATPGDGTAAAVEAHLTAAEGMLQQAVTDGFSHAHMVYTNMLEVCVMTQDDARIQKLVELMDVMLVKPSRLFQSMLGEYRHSRRKATVQERVAEAASERVDAVYRSAMMPRGLRPAGCSSRLTSGQDEEKEDVRVRPPRKLAADPERGDFESEADLAARGRGNSVRARRHLQMKTLGIVEGGEARGGGRYWEESAEQGRADGKDRDQLRASQNHTQPHQAPPQPPKKKRTTVSPIFDSLGEQAAVARGLSHGDMRLAEVPVGELKVWARNESNDRSPRGTHKTWHEPPPDRRPRPGRTTRGRREEWDTRKPRGEPLRILAPNLE